MKTKKLFIGILLVLLVISAIAIMLFVQKDKPVDVGVTPTVVPTQTVTPTSAPVVNTPIPTPTPTRKPGIIEGGTVSTEPTKNPIEEQFGSGALVDVSDDEGYICINDNNDVDVYIKSHDDLKIDYTGADVTTMRDSNDIFVRISLYKNKTYNGFIENKLNEYEFFDHIEYKEKDIPYGTKWLETEGIYDYEKYYSFTYDNFTVTGCHNLLCDVSGTSEFGDCRYVAVYDKDTEEVTFIAGIKRPGVRTLSIEIVGNKDTNMLDYYNTILSEVIKFPE